MSMAPVGSPVTPVTPTDVYTHPGVDDMPLVGMFNDLQIHPNEQLVYSYGSKELAPPPCFEPQMTAPPYGGSYDPYTFGFY